MSDRPALERLYEGTPAMLVSADAGGRLQCVSDAFLTRLGYTRAEVIGRSSVDFLTPESQLYARIMARDLLFRTGRLDRVAVQFVHRDGTPIDMLLTAVTDGPPNGQPQGRIGIVEDLTDLHPSECALAEEGRRLANVIEATQAGTWEWNVRTGALTLNRRWTDILGYTAEQLAPISIQTRIDLLHPDDLAAWLAAMGAYLAGETAAYEFEGRMRHRDGHYVWVQGRGMAAAYATDGKPEWMFGTIQDISDRKRQEAALRKSEAFLERTGQLAGVGGWELDLLTGHLTWSAETVRIHRLPPDHQPQVDTAIDFYAPEARPVIRAAVETAIAGNPGWDLELPLIRADGCRIWVRALGSVETRDGQPLRLIGAVQDVTAQVEARAAMAYANERISLATESGGIGIWDWDLVQNRVEWDSQMRSLLGLPERGPSDPEVMWQCLHPEDAPAARRAMRTAIAGGQPLDTTFRAVVEDGGMRTLRAAGRVICDPGGRPLRLIGVNWDVTERQRLATELAEQHELLRVTLSSIGDGVITTDASGRLTRLNPAAERLTGWTVADAKGRPLDEVFQIVHAGTREAMPNPLAACLAADGRATRARGVADGPGDATVLLCQTGAEYGIQESAAPIRNREGAPIGMVLVFHDVTEQRRLTAEMSRRATYDSLTGLVNRAEFESRLTRLMSDSAESSMSSALLFIDLDKFKIVNDTCGHSAGDELLRQVSALLASLVRGDDTVARVGGDEFAVILGNCPEPAAQSVAQQICDSVASLRFVHDGQTFRVGASVGLLPIDRRWATPAAVMQAADASCYAAKAAGRNRVHTWADGELAIRARHGEMRWVARLERALDEDGFVLFAQRIEPLAGDAVGLQAEVLLRMPGEDGIPISPAAFLPAAERFHLVSRIDRWVLTTVISWMQASATPGRIGMLTVNLSGQSVGDREFHRWALDRLQAAGPFVCSRLCLEVTETAAVTNMAVAAQFLRQARALRVRVALDDFGAGASSFGYLRTLPVDLLKIDGQFVRNLVHDKLDAAAVQCFLDVAAAVGIETVAECVETPDVLDRLRQMGVDYAQGFLLHRPVPLSDLIEGPGSGSGAPHEAGPGPAVAKSVCERVASLTGAATYG